MYYPKSQIQSNLYTNGGEFVIINTIQSYTGYYHRISNGKIFTGPTPTRSSQELTPVSPNSLLPEQKGKPLPTNTKIIKSTYGVTDELDLGYPINQNYRLLQQNPPQSRYIPNPYNPQPTPKEYKLGEMQRYFSKKTNEISFKEISQEDYQKLTSQDETIAWDLYNAVKLPWKLTGDKTQVYTINKSTVQRIEQNQKWYGFTQYFKDRFLNFYLAS